jgi:hypothetical protein
MKPDVNALSKPSTVKPIGSITTQNGNSRTISVLEGVTTTGVNTTTKAARRVLGLLQTEGGLGKVKLTIGDWYVY